MASIIKRNNKFKAQVSIYKDGKAKVISKTFSTYKEAKHWSLERELDKGNGRDFYQSMMFFTDYYHNWINLIKKPDIKETTFQNYLGVEKVVNELFEGIRLNDLSDLIVQRKIDLYGKNHSEKTTREALLKIKGCIRDAYARGYIKTDFTPLLKVRGKKVEKRNKTLSITDLKTLRAYCLRNADDEFNLMVLVALETGMRRGEILGIRKEDLYEYGIKVRRSISPTSEDTSLKTQKAKRNVSINQNVYDLLIVKNPNQNGYLFDPNGFSQSYRLSRLLQKLNISKTTFHGLRDTHASFLFSQEIDMAYISQRLGHVSIATTQNYYLTLMPEKKHQQDADALNLLNSLSN